MHARNAQWSVVQRHYLIKTIPVSLVHLLSKMSVVTIGVISAAYCKILENKNYTIVVTIGVISAAYCKILENKNYTIVVTIGVIPAAYCKILENKNYTIVVTIGVIPAACSIMSVLHTHSCI